MAIEHKSLVTANNPFRRKSGLFVNFFHGLQKHDPPSESRDACLEREPSSPSKSHRKLSCAARSDIRAKLKKSERFDYEVISVKDESMENEEDNEYNEDKMMVQQQVLKPTKSPVPSLGLAKRKFTLCVESEQRDLESRGSFLPRFRPNTNSRYCSRDIFMNSSGVARHFCDILGPGMCSDCVRTRKQQASIDDFIESFPEISVSPYMLCVPSDNDSTSKTPSQVYRDCDMFRKRSTSRLSCPDILQGSPTRPNSSGFSVSPNSSNWPRSSPTNFTHGSQQRRHNTAPSSISSRPSSRRGSFMHYIDSRSEDARHLETFSESESQDQETRTVKSVKITRSRKRGSFQSTVEKQSTAELHQNVFHKAISERTSGNRRSSRTTAIERRGKLSELPYWKFLIPEPPIMEVGRMNVSIYTPKDIPGIKIFDESLFDISVMS